MKNFFKLYWYFLKYVGKYKYYYIFSWIAVLTLLFFNNYVLFLTKDLVDNISDSPEKIPFILLTIAGVMAVPLILEPLTFLPKVMVYKNGVNKTVEDMYITLLKQDYGYHLNRQSGKLISKLIQGYQLVHTFIWDIEYWVLDSIAAIVVPLILMFTLHPYVSIATFLALLVSIPMLIWAMKLNVSARAAKKDAEYDRNSILVDGITNFETVRSFGNEDYEANVLEEKAKVLEKTEHKYQNAFRIVDFLTRIASILIFSAAGYTAYWLLQRDLITPGGMVVVIAYQFQLIGKLFGLFFSLRGYLTSEPVNNDIVEILESKPEIVEPANPVEIKNPKGEIIFDKVSFQYKDSNKVLDSLSLTIKPEQTVAFVGPSGGGKTTAVRLLMRYYDTTGGEVRIDGVDVRKLGYSQLRELFGLVPQEPVLFNRSIFYNVAYALHLNGKEDEEKHREIVEEACKKAQIHDFIMTLPQKYDTMVGERGLKLSGGQKQRIAIARVIIKDPKIVIFDEATSMLDSESEMAIQKAFKELSKDKTTIVIAHRLSTIRSADQIFVLGDGKILEKGTHKELLAKKGVYDNLWEIQSGGFIKG